VDFEEQNGFQQNVQIIMKDLELRAMKESKGEPTKFGFFPFSPMHLAENSDERIDHKI
jgi:hypothetical protein